MKVYISVDFEGVSGSTSWESTNLGDLEHGPLAKEMTLEAVAACEGALAAGATEIYVKDAHDSEWLMAIFEFYPTSCIS